MAYFHFNCNNLLNYRSRQREWICFDFKNILFFRSNYIQTTTTTTTKCFLRGLCIFYCNARYLCSPNEAAKKLRISVLLLWSIFALFNKISQKSKYKNVKYYYCLLELRYTEGTSKFPDIWWLLWWEDLSHGSWKIYDH